uniref:Uncharacterized protein n=1 Tax=Arundo donax TaxID=35708 RepID=A0A0A9HBW7_ARUDO
MCYTASHQGRLGQGRGRGLRVLCHSVSYHGMRRCMLHCPCIGSQGFPRGCISW